MKQPLLIAALSLLTVACDHKIYSSFDEAVSDSITQINQVYGEKVIVILTEKPPPPNQDHDDLFTIQSKKLDNKLAGWTNGPERWLAINSKERIDNTPYVLAHEFGHVYGLDHFETEKCKLMHYKQKQFYLAEEAAEQLKTCLEEKNIDITQYRSLPVYIDSI
jgi:hypothetical protein